VAAAMAQVGAILRDLPLDEWRDTLQALERADVSGIENRLPIGQKIRIARNAFRHVLKEESMRLFHTLGGYVAGVLGACPEYSKIAPLIHNILWSKCFVLRHAATNRISRTGS
jgi:hypothetical protein